MECLELKNVRNTKMESEYNSTCPECKSPLQLNCVTFEHEAIEVPGAGWYCNSCGMFQCHGKLCTYCGWPRNKKKK